MLDLYESKNGVSRRVASIPFSEVLSAYGVRRFWEIQKLLNRKIVYVRQDSTVDSTLRADGGRVNGQQHHSSARQVPEEGGAEAGKNADALSVNGKSGQWHDSKAGAAPD